VAGEAGKRCILAPHSLKLVVRPYNAPQNEVLADTGRDFFCFPAPFVASPTSAPGLGINLHGSRAMRNKIIAPS